MSIFERVFSHIEASRSCTAIKYSGNNITYSELINAIKAFSKIFRILGVYKGERVLVLLPNCPEFVAGFFAITQAGGAAVLADTKLNNEILGICSENDIRFVLTNNEGEEKINRIWDKSMDSELDASIEKPKVILSESLDVFNGAKPIETENSSVLNISPDETAMILYTSGSTGRSKGIINSHRTLEEALKNYVETLKFLPSDRFLAVTPFFHSYCFGSCMLAGLASGSTLIIEQRFQPRVIMKLITEEQVTVFHGVPYMYNLMVQHLNSSYSFKSLRYCISAGAALPYEAAQAFKAATGMVIHQEYGSSETGTIAINLSDDLEKNICSVGRPLCNVQLRIEKDEDLDIGIIQVNSRGRSTGYIGEDGFEDGWYTTGDLGNLNDEGYIHILGRVNRLINTSGLKVNPSEVESCLLKHPQVSDVLVRGAKHPDFGEVVEALVVRRGDELTEDALSRFCQGNLALFKIPKIFRWVDSLSKSGIGKNIID